MFKRTLLFTRVLRVTFFRTFMNPFLDVLFELDGIFVFSFNLAGKYYIELQNEKDCLYHNKNVADDL